MMNAELQEDGSVTVTVNNDTWATAEQQQQIYEAMVEYADSALQLQEAQVKLQGYSVGLIGCVIGLIVTVILFRRL